MRHALIFETEILPFELEDTICVYLLRKVTIKKERERDMRKERFKIYSYMKLKVSCVY